jgi:hypothetical protein
MPDLAAIEHLCREMCVAQRAEELRTPGPPTTRRTLAGCVIEYDGRRLAVWREAGRRPLPRNDLEPDTTVQWDNRFLVTATAHAEAGLTVAALGEAGLRLVQPFTGEALARYARPALMTLPAVWRGDQLFAVPFLDLEAKSGPPKERDQLKVIWPSSPWAQSQSARFRLRQEFMTDGLYPS